MSSVRTVNQAVNPSPPGVGETRYFTTAAGAFIQDENGVVTALGLVGEGATVKVSTLSDFPAPVGGIITLAANTTYEIMQSIDIGANAFAGIGPTAIVASSEFVVGLTTSTPNPMFAFTGTINTNRISLTNNGGKVFAFSSVTGACQLMNTLITGTVASTFAGGFLLAVVNSVFLGKGFVQSGSWTALAISLSAFTLAGAVTAIEIVENTTITTVIIDGVIFNSVAGQTAFDIDIGVIPTTRGRVTNTFFVGAGTPIAPGAADQTTIGWFFQGCPGIEDSGAIGAISFAGNATATVIAGVDTDTVINTGATAWALDTGSERFVLNADDRSIEYTGIEDVRALVHVDTTMEGAANNKVFEIAILHDTGSGPVEVANFQIDYRQTPVGRGRQKILSLSTGDLIEIQVRNTTDAVDVTVISAEISVKV